MMHILKQTVTNYMFPSVANTTAMEDRMQGQSQKNVPHHIIKEHVNVGGFPRKKKSTPLVKMLLTQLILAK